MQTKITVGLHTISQENRCFIIAEAGVNHNGNIDMALDLVRKAKACGADCVKFQTFKAEHLSSATAPKAAYQLETTNPGESQMEMLKNLELGHKDFERIIKVCESEDISFLSTPYSIADIDLLEKLGVNAYKVASGQTVEPFFLKHAASKNKPIILSTGMCTLAEVDEAVQTIRAAGNEDIVVLQCTTNYPAAPCDANIKAMVTMRDAFKVLVGYSDHTTSMTASIASIALGACAIERHFTLDKQLPGPDHLSSLNPEEFSEFVQTIRETEATLGNGLKLPADAEIRNLPGVRRAVVAAQDIAAGTTFTPENLTVKRPLNGLSAKYLPLLFGHKAARDIASDEPLDFEAIQ